MLLPAAAAAQVTWTLDRPSVITADDRERILSAAAAAGLDAPAEAREFRTMPLGLKGVEVVSAKTRAGLCRSWQSVSFLLAGDDRGVAADDRQPHQWRAGDIETHTEWLVEDGSVQLWIQLIEYYLDRVYTVSYEDARRVVLAFIRGEVVDRRPSRARDFLQQPDLPVRSRAAMIRGVASTSEGWEVHSAGWLFQVVLRGGQFHVTSNDFPIP